MSSWSILYVPSRDSSLGWYLPWPGWCDTPLSSLMTSHAYLIIPTHLSNHFFFYLGSVSHLAGISVVPVTFIIHPLQVMIATTDTLTLVFSARSRLKCFQKILHLWSLVTVSKFEKFSSDALRKFASSDQTIACQLNPRLWEISEPKFPQSHPKIALRSSTDVDFTGIMCNLLRILIFIGDLCSGFSLLSLQGSMGAIFAFL